MWQTDRRTDGETERRTDGQTDRKCHSLSCLVAANKNSTGCPWSIREVWLISRETSLFKDSVKLQHIFTEHERMQGLCRSNQAIIFEVVKCYGWCTAAHWCYLVWQVCQSPGRISHMNLTYWITACLKHTESWWLDIELGRHWCSDQVHEQQAGWVVLSLMRIKLCSKEQCVQPHSNLSPWLPSYHTYTPIYLCHT